MSAAPECGEHVAPAATESTPLLPSATSSSFTTEPSRSRPFARTVTFNANPVSKTFSPERAHDDSTTTGFPHRPKTSHFAPGPSFSTSPGGSSQPGQVLSALKSNLRRRNSAGGAASPAGLPIPTRIGPQRTTKNAQKLKLLPNPELDDEQDEESGREVYSQYTRIKDPNARRDAARLGKADRARLPRVTAYCTANRYNLDGLMRFLKGRGKSKGANPKRIDECIYTPYSYESEWSRERRLELRQQDSGFASQASAEHSPVQAVPYERRHSTGSTDATATGFQRDDLLMSLDDQTQGHAQTSGYGNGFSEGELLDESAVRDHEPDFDIQVHMPEIFLFEYGVVVIWGMSTAQELRFLKETQKFELESLPANQVETEYFNFYYTREYQPRIYNDFITLRDKYNYMTKLAISHALAQSVKTSLFEESIATTIETCKEIPEQIARTGHINLSRTQINMQIGELFILRISVHLNGAVLDSPELFWVEPQLEPVYQAVRSYLEMDQRVGLLTDRLDVVADLLAVLKEQLNHGHGEKLEWIVIVLIAMEILVAAINIVVDLYAGV